MGLRFKGLKVYYKITKPHDGFVKSGLAASEIESGDTIPDILESTSRQ